ncbi:hypothetical protein GL50803_004705 [Giardia duodenalis]|uniref:Uncharacterized protein n=2 Tax=Giardia intestinalis TaxID=5741 RepID=A8BPG8_GIAIC|nr:hypothetical protein GL50803_004705 [Giardia intestinalis]ESU37824.1 Hypothetical protein DHA2_151484 [Giardia intestinalis]KAE8303292.1 hypothetical protein GL50803_004705 [Giardia intestinalis]|eukprot:XP_001705748.1 Hypothetical protein GL50803_4705 [Giardia lamblia ATCC 50803]
MTKASGCAGETAKWFTVVGAAAGGIGMLTKMLLGTDHVGNHVYQLALLFWMVITLISDFGTGFGDSFIENSWSGFIAHHLFRGAMMLWWGLAQPWYENWSSSMPVETWFTHVAFVVLVVCAICVIIIGSLAMCGVC